MLNGPSVSTCASPSVVAWSVSAPDSAGFRDHAGGGLVLTAECLRDDGGRGLEDKLSDRGGPATLRRDADFTLADRQDWNHPPLNLPQDPTTWHQLAAIGVTSALVLGFHEMTQG